MGRVEVQAQLVLEPLVAGIRLEITPVVLGLRKGRRDHLAAEAVAELPLLLGLVH
jgi:hypothetical protein